MTKHMSATLKLEELAQFACCVYLFAQLPYPWWIFPACLFLPDVSMIGYLGGNRSGALCYNIFHHKMLAIVVGICGFFAQNEILQLVGIILYAHSAMDRMLGYGLKYEDGFKFTHLGRIGKD